MLKWMPIANLSAVTDVALPLRLKRIQMLTSKVLIHNLKQKAVKEVGEQVRDFSSGHFTRPIVLQNSVGFKHKLTKVISKSVISVTVKNISDLTKYRDEITASNKVD